MRHDPADPHWPDRDRFVLSAGHACMLQYAALHLTGYDLTMDDLKAFRQWGSKTPGHPERLHTPGIEVTTGPLGQGIGNAVGMALAERMLAARYNVDAHEIVNHRTFAICSDGDLMEGVSGEASSIAGFLGLGKLCLIWDDNHITIEGSTDLAFTEDVPARYEAYGWHVQRLGDDWTLDSIREALAAAEAETERPSFIQIRTHIALRRPARAGHREGARRTARRRGDPPHQAGVRLGSRQDVLRAGRGLRRHRRARPRRASSARTGRRASRSTASRTPTSPRTSSACSRASSRRLGVGAPRPLGRQAAGDARELGRVHQRARRARSPSSSAARPTWPARRSR